MQGSACKNMFIRNACPRGELSEFLNALTAGMARWLNPSKIMNDFLTAKVRKRFLRAIDFNSKTFQLSSGMEEVVLEEKGSPDTLCVFWSTQMQGQVKPCG